MNSKINSQLSRTEPKKPKTIGNNQNRNRITEMEITWRGRMRDKVQGIRSE